VYHHKVLRDFYSGWELRWFQEMRTPQGFIRKTLKKLGIALLFYFGSVLLIPLVMLPKALFDHRIRFLVLTGGVVTVGLGLETWLLPHYIAPFAAGIYAIILQCMRHMRTCRPLGRSRGLSLVRVIPVICVLMTLIRLYAQPLNVGLPSSKSYTAYGIPPLGDIRARVLEHLQSLPGKQLAVVRYSNDHDAANEWVYNDADIDRSKVVWARDMGPVKNRELLDYFKDREVWLVQPDRDPPSVQRFRPNELGAAAVPGYAAEPLTIEAHDSR
jgi:hypothetical protein